MTAGRPFSAAGKAGAAIALAVFALTAGLWTGGYLERFEAVASDLRAGVLRREVPSDILIIGIDAASLRELGEWPWRRTHHARLLERLLQAQPAQVFLDIDFSSLANAEDDARLESALAAWKEARPESPVVLPVFVQPATGADEQLVLTQPLERFARHVELGSVDQRPGRDGLVREALLSIQADGRTYPAAVVQLAGSDLRPVRQPHELTPIDFSIDPASFAFLSYSDVINGRVPDEELAGRTVLVGGWALELGDTLAVPVHRALPGVAVQALALQTIRAGGIHTLPARIFLPLLALVCGACAILFCSWSWRRNLLVLAAFAAVVLGVKLGAYALARLDFEATPLLLSAGLIFVVVSLKSLDEHMRVRQAQRRQLEFLAQHDSLTELPNRVALASHLERVLTGVSPGEAVALLMLDLCRFKEVNDTLGHNVGDKVLCEVAHRFRDCLATRHSDAFIARIGGDEFTVVLDRVRERGLIEAVAKSLQECLRQPIDAAGIALDVGLSIGIALCPQDAQDAQTLLKRADVAMYLCKREGMDFEFYDPARDEHSVRRLSMVADLRNALANDTLELRYQPQVNLRTGRVESLEALLRWRHPMMGMVNPEEFVAVAEATDLIRPLTEWTLREALGQIAALGRRGKPLRIAVNLSPRMLQDSQFPQMLAGLLIATGVEPRMLELEITESAMMHDPTRALRIIRELHALGVLISIDDYGTGFSSLSYLRDLPIHALKLDKSFVVDLPNRADDRVIVKSTADMARALNLKSVAEGVETPWHASFLASAGYDYAQGYCYTQALPADHLWEWLMRYESEPQPARMFQS